MDHKDGDILTEIQALHEIKVTEGLKPCPFCGGEAERKFIGNEHTKKRNVNIVCRCCHTEQRTGAIRYGHDQCDIWATEKWNKRIYLYK